MVTGGYIDPEPGEPHNSGGLASTELLRQDASKWVYAGSLPSARHRAMGATLGGKLIMTGEMMVMKVYSTDRPFCAKRMP